MVGLADKGYFVLPGTEVIMKFVHVFSMYKNTLGNVVPKHLQESLRRVNIFKGGVTKVRICWSKKGGICTIGGIKGFLMLRTDRGVEGNQIRGDIKGNKINEEGGLECSRSR